VLGAQPLEHADILVTKFRGCKRTSFFGFSVMPEILFFVHFTVK